MSKNKDRVAGSATMHDVAKVAGVSYTTVSYVMSRSSAARKISEETSRRVLRAADELGYRRNEIARAIVTGKSRVLAFIAPAPEIGIEFKARLLIGVCQEAAQHGYSVKVLHLSAGKEQTDSVIEQCLSWRVAGAIMVSLSPSVVRSLTDSFGTRGIDSITVEDQFNEGVQSRVVSDHEQGIRLALTHFRERGHERVAYLAAQSGDITGQERVVAFQRVVHELGMQLAQPSISYGDWWDLEANRSAARELLSGTQRATAILANGDAAALTVMSVARNEFGWETPGDVSVIGFGDYSMATYSNPPLTSISQPFVHIGQKAVEKLLEAEGHLPHTIIMPTHIVVRASTQTLSCR